MTFRCVLWFVLFTLIETGSNHQCYSCEGTEKQLYTPTQCSQNQINATCDDQDDICMHVHVTYRKNSETREAEFKSCVSVNNFTSKVNEICNETKGDIIGCNHACCQENLCNNDINEGDRCLQCEHCPGPEEGLVFNHSTPLNTSYSSHQCENDAGTMICPRGKVCAKVYRKFQSFETEQRSCISEEHCEELKKLCGGNNTRNDTKCYYRCCRQDLCNSTSRPHLALLIFFTSILFSMLSV